MTRWWRSRSRHAGFRSALLAAGADADGAFSAMSEVEIRPGKDLQTRRSGIAGVEWCVVQPKAFCASSGKIKIGSVRGRGSWEVQS